MISRDYIANTTYSFFVVLTTAVLWSLNEYRFDAYISLFTLEYLIVKTIFRPRRVFIDLLAATLVVIFFIFVSLRIYLILFR